MFTFALKKGLIEVHPMTRYGRIPEDEKARRVMEVAEERMLVQAIMERDAVVGAYVGVLGETGLRMTEGMLLKREFVNLSQRILTVEASKNYRTRHVPLSDYALELLRGLPVVFSSPYVFSRLETMDRIRDPRGPLLTARKARKMEWVGFHDFRHFRATQWVKQGIDLRTVQELLGHRDITTTMRYAHFAPMHASRRIIEAQRLEAAEWTDKKTQSTGTGEKQAKGEPSLSARDEPGSVTA